MCDPYPAYRRLRDEDPVHRIDAYQAWAVTRMDDVWMCFAQPEVYSNSGGITGAQLLQRRMGPYPAVVDYGLHLSVSVVCELLAIPTSDRPMLTDWVRLIFYRPAAEAGLTDAGADAYEQILDYCAEHARSRHRDGARSTRANPDLLDGYLAMNVGDDLASHLREVVIGGSETNPKVLAATIHRLAQHEAQRAQVAADPALA